VPRPKLNLDHNHVAYIGMGSNLGDRQIFISYGIKRLSRIEDSGIGAFSGLYATEPVGVQNRTPFLNMVVKFHTSITIDILLDHLQRIEKEAGRTDAQRKKSRVLDMDILFFDDDIITREGLIVPHPEVHNRRFMLEPLAEIAGDLVHPVKKKKIKKLLEECPKTHWVKRL